jgi:hypothetical protein
MPASLPRRSADPANCRPQLCRSNATAILSEPQAGQRSRRSKEDTADMPVFQHCAWRQSRAATGVRDDLRRVVVGDPGPKWRRGSTAIRRMMSGTQAQRIGFAIGPWHAPGSAGGRAHVRGATTKEPILHGSASRAVATATTRLTNRLASVPRHGHTHRVPGTRRGRVRVKPRRRRRNRPPETLRHPGPQRAGISGKPNRAQARGSHRRSKGLHPRISQVP